MSFAFYNGQPILDVSKDWEITARIESMLYKFSKKYVTESKDFTLYH